MRPTLDNCLILKFNLNMLKCFWNLINVSKYCIVCMGWNWGFILSEGEIASFECGTYFVELKLFYLRYYQAN